MKNYNYPIIVVVLLVILLGSCERKHLKTAGLAFYNVENLFDTIDDPHINDNSHLPDSKIPWTTQRYKNKLDNLAKVIASVDTSGFPVLFGLCEVENIDVVQDLINHPELIQANYSVLHKDSPDERGIDVALLYIHTYYRPVETGFIEMIFPWDSTNTTRDVLYSKGVIGENDTLHVFINHWVSRWGGKDKTDPSRRYIGNKLKQITDSIFWRQPGANIIIAGDLNDNPTDPSISEKLKAFEVKEPIKENSLYNLSYTQFTEGQGTLYYRSWDMFDQIIVSSSMLTGSNGLKTTTTEQVIVKYDWMMYESKNGLKRPSRTASGGRYFGGYSDHLPVLIRFELR